MMRAVLLLIAVVAVAAAAPASACDDSPDLPILPGETEDKFEERYNRTWEELRVIHRYEAQKSLLGQASSAYVGRVESRQDLAAAKYLHSVTIRPVHSLKGKLPPGTQSLVDTMDTSCGQKGDGGATDAEIGEWVIVFAGLPKSDWRPHGISSVLARDALTEELIAGLWEVGKSPD